MKEVFVEAVGLAAPGIPTWRAAQTILAGATPYISEVLPPHTPTLLPVNERRRATPTIRLAFQAAEDALQSTSIAPASLATVFASSDADLGIIHRICSALTVMPRMISPTDFHNSVHNAAAGYWSIAVGARGNATTLSAYDYSFAAGLSEAFGTVFIESRETLLVAFDLPPPAPLYAKRPMREPTGVALVLTQQRTHASLAALTIERTTESETTLADRELESLRLCNPAARALPLLVQLARKASGKIILPWNADARLLVELRMV